MLALEDMMDVVESGHGEHGSEDGDDRGDSDTELDDNASEQNGNVDIDANGKNVDRRPKGWLRWW